MIRAHLSKAIASWLLAAMVLFSMLGYSPVAASPVDNRPQEDSFAHFNGVLQPGETIEPIYQLFGSASLNINLKMQIPAAAGDGSIQLTVLDGGAGTAFASNILDGETLWANTTLTLGINRFTLYNPSTLPLPYDLWLYNVADDPFSWSGASQATGGWASHLRLNFRSSGLYTFDFEAAEGRYQFQLESDYLQKTAEGNGEVTYFIPAGIHPITVTQDTQVGAAWNMQISSAGAFTDTLPYHKSGGNLGGAGNDFVEEWLPLYLEAAVPVNFRLALQGQTSDALNVFVYGGNGTSTTYTVTNVYGSETLWWSMDLPAGLSRVHLAAADGNVSPLAYDLTIAARPELPTAWNGISTGYGNHSRVRFTIPQEGLFNFQYGLTTGRYQFVIDNQFIQKTTEETGSVIYYLPAGVHEMIFIQDTTVGPTSWSMNIAPTGLITDTLPYQKSGGELGGLGNEFSEEWLPLYLETAGEVNLRLAPLGDLADGLTAHLYHGNTLVYTSPVVYGGETFWGTTNLITGENHIQLTAENGNADPLQYQLTVEPIPTDDYTWSGIARGGAGNSEMRVEAQTDGLYHVRLETAVGFAQVQVDHVGDKQNRLTVPGHTTEFDIPLEAGLHSLGVLQDPAYPTTTWRLHVAPAITNALIAQFSGTLPAGVQIDPQLPLFGAQEKKVNFRLQVLPGSGSSAIHLGLTDGAGGNAFAGTALDGETLWGTAILKPGANTFALHNTSAENLVYNLKVYEVGSASYDWAGLSRGAGAWNSHIRLQFPSSALYTFDFGQESGRYQFFVEDSYLQKTVENDGEITYFVPAGEHLITITQDTQAGAHWNLNISAAGAPTDTLPYHKTGGDLGGAGNDFDTEWLPLNLETATPVNFRLILTGAVTATLDVAVYSGAAESAPIYTVHDVHGGETLWWNANLSAGISRVELVAAAGPLAYDLMIVATPQTPLAWSGLSQGNGNLSQLRFIAPQTGLYDFDYATTAGRYQFLVAAANVDIQKTVETTGGVRYYLPAGMHHLTIVQDSAVAQTAWALSIAPAGIATDALPYTKDGGNLGGQGNTFAEEWLPIYLADGQEANFRLTLDGDLADGLVAYLFHDSTAVYTTPILYGGETFWWNADLTPGVNHLRLVAQNGNATSLQYHLTVNAIPAITDAAPLTWSGLSKGSGGNSQVRLHASVDGIYHVKLDVPSGFANILIANAATGYSWGAESVIEFDVPLDEGDYLFTIQQSPGYVTTSWSATVSAKDTPPPQITAVNPMTITNEAPAEVTIFGANFQPGARVFISATEIVSVTVLNASEIHIIVPARMTPGTYSVKVVNPDDEWALLEDALEIVLPVYRLYLPLIVRSQP